MPEPFPTEQSSLNIPPKFLAEILADDEFFNREVVDFQTLSDPESILFKYMEDQIGEFMGDSFPVRKTDPRSGLTIIVYQRRVVSKPVIVEGNTFQFAIIKNSFPLKDYVIKTSLNGNPEQTRSITAIGQENFWVLGNKDSGDPADRVKSLINFIKPLLAKPLQHR